MSIAVTVVIPTLQEEANICRLLTALRAQQYDGQLELIVVDGGSTDGTREIVSRFGDVHLLTCRPGVSRQRNKGGRTARGELLIFMDADNSPGPSFVHRIVRSYRRVPFAVACPWFFTRGDGATCAAAYLMFNVAFWLGQSTLRTGSGVCLVTPRTVFSGIGGFEEGLHLGEDIRYIRAASPRHGLHRHLLVPLLTSGRRFGHCGALNLLWFYLRISPHILLGNWQALQKIPYPAAPYAAASAPSPSSSSSEVTK